MNDDLRKQVRRIERLHPDTTVDEICSFLDLGTEERALVDDVLREPQRESRWDVPLDEQCAQGRCRNQRLNPHPHSLCASHYPSDDPPEPTIGTATLEDSVTTLAEARAVAGLEDVNEPDSDPSEPHLPPEHVSAASSTANASNEDGGSGFALADAMGTGQGTSLENTEPESPEPTSAPSADSGVALPTSALPLGQLDAMSPSDRRRAAKQRGLDWVSTDDARDKLFDTVATVMREEDDRVVDAPTSLGKTYTVSTTRWGARDDITGGKQVVHLLQTRDARDEAVAAAEEDGGEYFVLKARHEACPVAAGDHDPEEDQDPEDDRQVITIDGEPASGWLSKMCDSRGIPFSVAHHHLEKHNDQNAKLPCCTSADSECPAIQQWEDLRNGDHPLVIATHNFAHVPSLRMQKNLVVDEEPDFAQDLETGQVRAAVAAYLREIGAPVTTWESFIQLSRYEGFGDDAYHEREALHDALNTEPDREWYFSNSDAHTLAPALARAIFHAEERQNGRRVGKTPYEPPRLDAHAHDRDGWNQTWLTVVLDESNDVQTVRSTPDLTLCRSVVGLDAHPALPVWQANTLPHIQRQQVLNSEQRQLWRRYERGLRVVQVGDATRPLASGEYFDWSGCSAIIEHLREVYGQEFRTAITASSVEDKLESIMDTAGVHDPRLMHYGEEKSRNDFGDETVGLVNGSIDPGDDFVLDLLAELDLDASPERSDRCCEHCGDRDAPETSGNGCHECLGTGWARKHGREFVGDDAETAQAILASVRENHTAQAAGRYARNPDDPTSTATVFVRTDAMPVGFADVKVPGVVWTYGKKQDRIVEALRESSEPLSARELADSADCSKEHVRKTLERLQYDDRVDDVQAFEDAGSHGATLYAAAGVPNSGVVDLDIANGHVWGSYTWDLAIRDPTPPAEATERGVMGSPQARDDRSRVWDWRDSGG